MTLRAAPFIILISLFFFLDEPLTLCDSLQPFLYMLNYITCKYNVFIYGMMPLGIYQDVPKLTRVITFGFRGVFLSPLSGFRYFRVTKTCNIHGLFEVNKIVTNMKTCTLVLSRIRSIFAGTVTCIFYT